MKAINLDFDLSFQKVADFDLNLDGFGSERFNSTNPPFLKISKKKVEGAHLYLILTSALSIFSACLSHVSDIMVISPFISNETS